MDQLEQVFIQGINEKSEKAFRELFGRFHNYLVMFALRRVRLLEAAEDIVQDVFLSFWLLSRNTVQPHYSNAKTGNQLEYIYFSTKTDAALHTLGKQKQNSFLYAPLLTG